MPLIVIFTHAACEPPHNNSCGPLWGKKKKVWHPDICICHV